uniref:Uncharacterized protein n=1 Tax=Lepeophtheirus salmonis TaxID=72036 RepID=A0A0K2TTN0_LEPSM
MEEYSSCSIPLFMNMHKTCSKKHVCLLLVGNLIIIFDFPNLLSLLFNSFRQNIYVLSNY